MIEWPYVCENAHTTTLTVETLADLPEVTPCRYVLENCAEVGCMEPNHEPRGHMGRWCDLPAMRSASAPVKSITVDVSAVGLKLPDGRPIMQISPELHFELSALEEPYRGLREYAAAPERCAIVDLPGGGVLLAARP